MAAAEWVRTVKPGLPTLAHLEEWERVRRQAGIEDDLPSPGKGRSRLWSGILSVSI